MQEVKCKNCQKLFKIPEWRIKKYKNNFCCDKCRREYFNTNKYIDKGDYFEIILKKYPQKHILIDKEDVEKCKKYTWTLWNGYVSTKIKVNNKRKCLKLHRYLMNCPEDKVIDHINHNTLDNRKCNLRVCTQSDNVKNFIKRKDNKTGFTGVYKCTGSKSYFTNIKVNGKIVYLGCFKEKEQAIQVRKQAEIKYWHKPQILDIIAKVKGEE